jgi:hypothetical protein
VHPALSTEPALPSRSYPLETRTPPAIVTYPGSHSGPSAFSQSRALYSSEDFTNRSCTWGFPRESRRRQICCFCSGQYSLGIAAGSPAVF